MDFAKQCELAGLPVPVPEHRFHPKRRWRFDWAFPAPHMLAVEVEGGAWSRGRHVRGKGFLQDCDKYNQAVLLGWRLLRVTPQQIASGEALALVERAFGKET